jgi:FkbM family methyltransferase
MNSAGDIFEIPPRRMAFAHSCHRAAYRMRARRWTKTVSYIPWACWMMTEMSLNPLVRGRLPSAIARQAFWQTWRRIIRRPISVRMGAGHQLALPPWSRLAGLTFATGMHEPREELFALAYLRPGDVAVDVGANIGIFSALMGSTGAHVIAFEPGDRSRRDLERTIGLNRAMTIIVVPVALSDQNGEMGLTTDLESSNHLVGPCHGESFELVSVMRLDDYLAKNPAVVTFIKIDAEGFDLEVLKGAERLLADQRPVLLVETWGPPTIRDWLWERGYRIYRYSFEDQTLREYPDTYNHQANIIAVHTAKLGSVAQRLSTATAPSRRFPRITKL